MSTQLKLGAVIDSTDVVQEFTFGERSERRGTLWVRSSSDRVFINWLGGATVDRTDAAGQDKGYFDAGQAIRIPKDCVAFSIQCLDAQSAKLLYLAD